MTQYRKTRIQKRTPSNEQQRRANIGATQRIPRDRSLMDESLRSQIRRSVSNSSVNQKRVLAEEEKRILLRDRAVEQYLRNQGLSSSDSVSASRRPSPRSSVSTESRNNRKPQTRTHISSSNNTQRRTTGNGNNKSSESIMRSDNTRRSASTRRPVNKQNTENSRTSNKSKTANNTRRTSNVRNTADSHARYPDNRRHASRKRRKKHSKVFVIILAIAAVLLTLIVFLGINVVITKNHASSLKNDLEEILECAKDKDSEGAEKALERSYKDKEKLSADLSGTFWTAASKIDRVKKELDAGNGLLEVVGVAQDDILTPLVALMKEQPLTDLKVGEDGFNVTLINSYLDFVEEIQPELESLMSEIMAVDTESMMGGYVAKYKDKLYEYTDAYTEASSMLPMLRVFLGNGEDRLYLFVAQNSAEIRASGGFPGSIGTIRIKDGVLTIGDFESVYQVLADTISYRSGVTDSELNIFGSWINAPRDACFIPAFDRAAEIWAVAYEDLQRENGAIDTYEGYVKANTYYDEWSEEYYFEGLSEEEYNEYNTYDGAEYMEYVDGVVSLTPAIIQMLMGDIGEITLSDGSILDSNNATKMLQYDLYHKYFNEDTITGASNSTSDALFAETAKTVMKEFVSNFEVSKFADYYKLFQDGKEKNIIQIWMADESEEEVITEAGFSGKLNYDSENPVTGIYFSLADPSKLGWYLDMIPEISEPEINDDGTRTYDVKVTLRNVMDEDEADISSWYIVGGYEGGIRGFIHCFAPAGGYITDVDTSNWMYMFEANYKDLEVYYDLDVLLAPGEEVEITYKVTTAEGVDTPLRAITTPTLTEYR